MTLQNPAPVTVIIPTFNRAGFIAEAIESMLAQRLPPQQLIVSDDGSSDDTATVVARFGERVSYVRNDNAGKSAAINRVMPLVTGEFVWIFDDDDFAYPDAIERHLSVHRDNPNLGFTFGAHDLGESGPDGRMKLIPTPPVPAAYFAPIEAQRVNLLKYCAVMLSACIVRRSALAATLPFREDLHRSQDYDMLIRLSQAFDFAYTGASTYILRKHEGVRGPAANQHGSTDRRKVWRDYDRKIGQSIATSLPLERYLSEPAATGEGEAGWRRMALIRRAWVMASKAHIEQLVADLLAASRESDEATALSPDERACCQSLVDHTYFLMCVLEDPKCLDPLHGLRGRLPGAEILKALGKGFYWKATEQGGDLRWPDRLRLLKCAASLMLRGAR